MTKRIGIATFLLVLLGLTLIGSVWAQTRIPGVFQGNTFTYDVTAFWSSSDPSAVVPAELQDINKTEYYQVIIGAVNGAEIATTSIWHFTNGTETTSSGTINVETGITTGQGFWAIVAGNLNVNDRLHPLGANYYYVNATVTRNYTSGERETNQLFLTLSGSDEGGDYMEHIDYSFDKQTGMLVQLNDAKVYSNPTSTTTRVWKIKDSNVGLIPIATSEPQPTPTQGGNPPPSDSTMLYVIIAAIAIIIPVVIAVIILRKRRRGLAEFEEIDISSLEQGEG